MDTEQMIQEKLQEVIDPELGFSVVALGLIYDIQFDDQGQVGITMTFTSPTCPASETLQKDIKEKLSALPFVKSVDIQIVFEPKWTAQMADDETKAQMLIMGIPITNW